MTVAEMIKQTRTASNMTQEEYGAKLGVSRQTVSSWENERSMPDLQMLIDICNTYHISLDKLLNEDHSFVNKIDFYGRIQKFLKIASLCLLTGMVIFLLTFARWNMIAADKNEAFADNARAWGFLLENGIYLMEENDVFYQLPNQKLPLFRDDFFVKNIQAYLCLDNVEIDMTVYEENHFSVTLNHNRGMSGTLDRNGEPAIIENTLNPEEKNLLNKHKKEIAAILEQLLAIHHSVYSS